MRLLKLENQNLLILLISAQSVMQNNWLGKLGHQKNIYIQNNKND